jgi:hypothetical protein
MRRLAFVLGTSLLSSAAFADAPATSAPDFVSTAPQRHIDRSLVASPDPVKWIEPGDVLPFEHNSAWLTDAGLTQVDAAARWLKAHPKHRLVLAGHTDALGLEAYNQDLATRRMAVVRERLRQRGIPSDRLLMLTYGELGAMPETNPLHGADRKVVMYSTELPPQTLVAMAKANRPALIATWTDRGTLYRVEQKVVTASKPIMVRR